MWNTPGFKRVPLSASQILDPSLAIIIIAGSRNKCASYNIVYNFCTQTQIKHKWGREYETCDQLQQDCHLLSALPFDFRSNSIFTLVKRNNLLADDGGCVGRAAATGQTLNSNRFMTSGAHTDRKYSRPGTVEQCGTTRLRGANSNLHSFIGHL